MNKYEALFVIDPQKEKSLDEVIKDIGDVIRKQKGNIEKEETWGKQRLAHPIKKNAEGIYYKLDFSIDPQEISALTSAYKLKGDVLRTIITKKPVTSNQ